jgi:hypothetical protein
VKPWRKVLSPRSTASSTLRAENPYLVVASRASPRPATVSLIPVNTASTGWQAPVVKFETEREITRIVTESIALAEFLNRRNFYVITRCHAICRSLQWHLVDGAAVCSPAATRHASATNSHTDSDTSNDHRAAR